MTTTSAVEPDILQTVGLVGLIPTMYYGYLAILF